MTTANRSASARCATTAHAVGVPIRGQCPDLDRVQPRLHLRLVAGVLRGRLHLAQQPIEHNGTYAAGDEWGCVGVWFSGRWYFNTDAYLNQPGDSVHWHYTNKTWLTSAFING